MTSYSSSKHATYFLGLAITFIIIKTISGFDFDFFLLKYRSLINVICLLLILSIGISHGSLDHIKGKKLLKIYKIKNKYVFYLSYIFISVLIIFFWLLFPALSLFIFLIVASYHFGKEDSVVYETETFIGSYKKFYRPKYNFLSFTLKGSMIIIFPLSFHFRETTEIFELLWINNEYFNDTLIYLNNTDFIGIVILFIPILSSWFMARWPDDFVFINFEVFSILVLNIIFTPLIAFTIYFCFLHSIRHSASLILELDNKNFSKGIKKFLKKALPLTLVTAILFIFGIYILTNYYVLDDAIMKVIFIGLASLTFPHILLEYLIEKNEK